MKCSKFGRRIAAVVLSLAMAVTFLPTAALAEDVAQGTTEGKISKSKTATDLDKNLESVVTLSLPAASYKRDLDVAFVLDGSTSADQAALASQAAELLDELAEMGNLNVKVSLTIFGGSTPILEDTELVDISDADKLAALKAMLTDASYDKKDGRSGSNLQAGVVKANTKLDEDTAVADEDKYIVILSDGAARMWYQDGLAMSQTYQPSNTIFWNSNEDFLHRYTTESDLRSFGDVWQAGQNGTNIGAYGMTEEQKNAVEPGSEEVATWETVKSDPNYYTTYEAATYYAACSIVEAASSKNIILVSYPYHNDKPYGIYTESFKSWLADNNYVSRYDCNSMSESAIFDAVKNELVYLIDAGSQVEDVIGNDFDLTSVESFKLTVDNQVLKGTISDDGTTVTFAHNGMDAAYVVTYDAETDAFVWKINEAVKKDGGVQLSYAVKLVNVPTKAGEYESNTNESATLEPKDSTGTVGNKEAFEVPYVSYTVEEPVPVEPDDPAAEDWEVSKSKTATNLDENFEAKVTLSLPSAEEQLVSDVVFVLDKSTSANLEQQALNMLSELKSQIEETNAKVNVGVVIFNKEAHPTDFMDLATQYDSIKEAIEQDISSGTNSHAGLLAGKAMLDADTSVDASRKYLIFISDGITYMYNAEPTATAWNFNNPNAKEDWHGSGSWANWTGPDNWYSKYHTNNAPDSWSDWLKDIFSKVAAQGTTYEYPYGGTATIATAEDINNWDTAYAMTIDKALYLTNQVYNEAVEAGYHCYAMTAQSDAGATYLWGPSFMGYLANGKSVTFDEIQNDIYYLVDEDSRVEDYIGYAENDYDFDFVNDASALSLKVGDTVYSAKKTAENTYSFADGDYIVTYEEGNKQDTEHFVWYIKVPVSNFAPVQLTYTVKLTNPKTADGTYGAYDADGSQKLDGLYTNLMAILYPIDTNGEQRMPEYFAKPTVSYTISNAKPVVPTPAPTPKDEHPEIAQAIKDGTWGKADPTPTPTVKPTSATVPQTGDNSNPVLWVVVMVMALAAFAGVMILRRRSNKD